MRHRHIPLAWIAMVMLLAGCGADDRPGTIVGQLYVILQSGNEARMDIRPVRLVPESARLDSTLSVLCIERNRTVTRLSRSADSIRSAHDSIAPAEDTAFARILTETAAATEAAMSKRAGILERVALRTTPTAPDASFTMDSVPPGKYRLWSDATLDSGHWNWLLPVTVKGGDSVRVALNNTNADDNPLKCPTPLGE